jgi:hypothetical protein
MLRHRSLRSAGRYNESMNDGVVASGIVNGEGGPLLLADRWTVAGWSGSDGDGTDYERACALLEGQPEAQDCVIAIDRGAGVIWEMQGAGTRRS